MSDSERTLPKWSVRLDAQSQFGFNDLFPIMSSCYRAHENIEKFLGPYNARQRNSTLPYQSPDRETLKQLVPQGRMNDFSYIAMINSIIRFCEDTKGQRAIPTPHPSVIHSIQLPDPAFELETLKNNDTMVSILGSDRTYKISGLRNAKSFKFLIIRPKLGQLGTASGKNWEMLFFHEPYGYIPDWCDSSINPRWAGKN